MVCRSEYLFAIEAVIAVWYLTHVINAHSVSFVWPSLIPLRKQKSRPTGHICTGSSLMLLITLPWGLWECRDWAAVLPFVHSTTNSRFLRRSLWPTQAMLCVENEVYDLGKKVKMTKQIRKEISLSPDKEFTAQNQNGIYATFAIWCHETHNRCKMIIHKSIRKLLPLTRLL